MLKIITVKQWFELISDCKLKTLDKLKYFAFDASFTEIQIIYKKVYG